MLLIKQNIFSTTRTLRVLFVICQNLKKVWFFFSLYQSVVVKTVQELGDIVVSNMTSFSSVHFMTDLPWQKNLNFNNSN